jgi:hypothetical protein
MISKYAVFAIATLLVLSSLSMVSAAGIEPMLPPGQVKTVGPQLNSILWTADLSDTLASSDVSTGTINAWDLSFSVATWATLTLPNNCATAVPTPKIPSVPATCTGSTPGYSFDGIYFNMLRAIVNDTHFHRAIAYLMNLSYFEDVYLEGVAGITTNALLPCAVFAACVNPASAPTYNSSNNDALVHAVFELQSIRECIGPFDYMGVCFSYGDHFLTARSDITGSTNSSDCAPHTAQSALTGDFRWSTYKYRGCDGLKWRVAITAQGTTAGLPFVPLWHYRDSLGRIYFSEIVEANGAKIGLSFTRVGDGTSTYAQYYVINAAVAATISDGKYIASGPQKGYNTAPVYNYSLAADGQLDGGWDMYSYGYSASANFIGTAEMMDDAFGRSTADAASYHNGTVSYDANKVVYATTARQAIGFGHKMALDQLLNLPYLNVYFENTLFGIYSNAWAGYANIPTYGPDTAGGLAYTALNVHRTCFVTGLKTPPNTTTCPNGGQFKLGLGATPDVPGGLNPLYSGLTVYDDDVWLNIYDSLLGTPPIGYQKPAQFMNWMTSKYTSKVCTSTSSKPNKCVGITAGWFNFQAPQGVTQKIYKGTVYTFYIKPNIYFTDHTQMTAYDYNYSLWAAGLVAPSSLPDLSTPYYGAMAGPLGLMATYIDPHNPLQIEVVVNSSSLWNLGDMMVPILPAHIFQPYFNLDSILSAKLVIDTSQPYALATDKYSNFTTGKPSAPEWLTNLPNLEVGTGPFQLRTNDEVMGSGLLIRNLNFYRNYWQTYTINASQQVHNGTKYHLDVPIYEWSYNSTICSTSDSICKVPMLSQYLTGGSTSKSCSLITGESNSCLITGAAQVVTPSGRVLASYPLVYNGTLGHVLVCEKMDKSGHCSITHPNLLKEGIPTDKLAIGPHEVIITAHYTYLGLVRTWYEEYGFKVVPVLTAGAITPSAPTIDNGQSVTLKSHASGGIGPYTYQWYSGFSAKCSSDTTKLGTASTQSVSPASSTYYCYSVTDTSSNALTVSSATDLVTANP